jgi:hypothetical protein
MPMRIENHYGTRYIERPKPDDSAAPVFARIDRNQALAMRLDRWWELEVAKEQGSLRSKK